MSIPDDRKYSREHEWVIAHDDGAATVGISDFAQEQLGDVVFIELPPIGATVDQFGRMGEIESVKAVSDLFSPVSGEVVEVNKGAVDKPELVNSRPYDEGWLVKVRLANPDELNNLMSATDYQSLIAAS